MRQGVGILDATLRDARQKASRDRRQAIATAKQNDVLRSKELTLQHLLVCCLLPLSLDAA